MKVIVDEQEQVIVDGQNKTVVITSDKDINLKNFSRIPENAFIISVDPLYFLQIGDGKLLVTDGVYWLDEKPSEVCRKSFCLGKSEEGWFLNIGVPIIILDKWLYRVRLAGNVLKNGIASYPHKLSDNEVFKTERMTIVVRDKCSNKNNFSVSCITEKDLQMVKIEFNNERYYVPRLFAKQKWGVEV